MSRTVVSSFDWKRDALTTTPYFDELTKIIISELRALVASPQLQQLRQRKISEKGLLDRGIHAEGVLVLPHEKFMQAENLQPIVMTGHNRGMDAIIIDGFF